MPAAAGDAVPSYARPSRAQLVYFPVKGVAYPVHIRQADEALHMGCEILAIDGPSRQRQRKLGATLTRSSNEVAHTTTISLTFNSAKTTFCKDRRGHTLFGSGLTSTARQAVLFKMFRGKYVYPYGEGENEERSLSGIMVFVRRLK